MNAKTIELLTWVLIFGGVVAASVGWFLQAASPLWGGLALTSGSLAVAAGVLLIVVRSRMKDSP